MATTGWQFWALASAVFAALTAIFGKIGVESINSNFATLIRTGVILVIILGTVVSTKSYQSLAAVSSRTYLFLILSGIATGLSWLCYYRALQIGPTAGVVSIDKLSVVFVALFSVLVLSERLSLVNWLGVAMIAAGAVLVGLRTV